MSYSLLDWKGEATPTKPGHVYFFCSATYPSARVRIAFAENYGPDTERLLSGYSRLVGLWSVADMRLTEVALMKHLGLTGVVPFELIEIVLFDWSGAPNGGNSAAELLIKSAIADIAETLMASGIGIRPFEVLDCEEPPEPLHSLPRTRDLGSRSRFDSEIESVMEFPDEGQLVFYLKCADDASQSSVQFKAIVFSGFTSYRLDLESKSYGRPKLIEISECGENGRQTVFEITTDTGNRYVTASTAHVTRYMGI